MPNDIDAMARTLANDDSLPIADRTFAGVIADRLRLQLRISADEAMRVRRTFVRRRAKLAQTLATYDAPPPSC